MAEAINVSDRSVINLIKENMPSSLDIISTVGETGQDFRNWGTPPFAPGTTGSRHAEEVVAKWAIKKYWRKVSANQGYYPVLSISASKDPCTQYTVSCSMLFSYTNPLSYRITHRKMFWDTIVLGGNQRGLF